MAAGRVAATHPVPRVVVAVAQPVVPRNNQLLRRPSKMEYVIYVIVVYYISYSQGYLSLCSKSSMPNSIQIFIYFCVGKIHNLTLSNITSSGYCILFCRRLRLSPNLQHQLKWKLTHCHLLQNPGPKQGKNPHLALQKGVTVNHLRLHRKDVLNHHLPHLRGGKGPHLRSQPKRVLVN